MTSADEAVERVRAYIAGLEGHHGRMTVDVNAGRSFTLDDLRALLSALELGSVASEAWRPIEGWGGRFLVSSMGRVKGPRGFMKGLPDRDGYPRVTLTLDGAKRTHSIHSLVAGAFLGPRPEGHDIDHIDKDRGNARLSNLRYVTHGENMEGVSSGLAGEGHPRAKLTEAQVSEIRASSETPSNLAARYGVSKGAICDIRSGRRWPVVTADEPATPSDLDALGRAMLNLNADRIAWRKGNPRPALLTLRDMDAIWAALSPTTLGGGSGSAQDGLPPARSHPSEPQAPSGDGWLPIESAPRDGTQFLALLSNGWFDLLRAPPEYSGPWPDGRAYLCWQGRNNPPIVETYSPDTVATTSIRATHWMPLPAPPSKASRHPVASDGEAKRPNTNNTQGEES